MREFRCRACLDLHVRLIVTPWVSSARLALGPSPLFQVSNDSFFLKTRVDYVEYVLIMMMMRVVLKSSSRFAHPSTGKFREHVLRILVNRKVKRQATTPTGDLDLPIMLK